MSFTPSIKPKTRTSTKLEVLKNMFRPPKVLPTTSKSPSSKSPRKSPSLKKNPMADEGFSRIMGGKWSRKYKRNINCNHPRGFSQKQYCKYGRRKTYKKH